MLGGEKNIWWCLSISQQERRFYLNIVYSQDSSALYFLFHHSYYQCMCLEYENVDLRMCLYWFYVGKSSLFLLHWTIGRGKNCSVLYTLSNIFFDFTFCKLDVVYMTTVKRKEKSLVVLCFLFQDKLNQVLICQTMLGNHLTVWKYFCFLPVLVSQL